MVVLYVYRRVSFLSNNKINVINNAFKFVNIKEF